MSVSVEPRRFRLHAPAKINLDLRIVGSRADGFHEVRTLLQSVALADTVTVTARRGPFTVRSRARAFPRDGANLVWTAGAALWRALGRPGVPAGVAVTLTKRIPAAAGLAGASSDAASALRALARLWAADRRTLGEVAAAVGSDVPFFLTGGTVLATGRGERLRALAPLDRHWLVLAVPPFGVSTPAAYRWWDEAPTVGPPRPPARWRRALDHLRNDLQPPVVARHPAVGEMAARLRAAGACHAAMTGSGSAVFGLFRSAAAARRARLAVRRRAWRTLVTRTVDRAEYARLAAARRID